MKAALAFELPAALEAREPPEARGLARDGVRLMVSTRGEGTIVHGRFRDLPSFLDPGDLLVINTSATLPAALAAHRADGSAVRVHFATRAPHLPVEDWWVVELRSPDGAHPLSDAGMPGRAGERLTLAGGAELEIVAPYASGARLLLARIEAGTPLSRYLAHHGEPIRYGYIRGRWPLAAYQTAYATVPGSAEMPSAGRPFTPELLTALIAKGMLIAPVTLHTGVSSPERHEPPYPERYEVPASTARLVTAARSWGGRVIAVGTTVVRALESATGADGTVAPASGWTGLVVTAASPLAAVDGLLTGWHEPEASHFSMLEAVAGAELIDRSYRAALAQGYLWHEFGDSQLILP
ncbi:MAG TPA: S-adenosylmethionine:tRNA ribosyltransferase-isomerase [Solirubrobacteraceae bacterium]|nr:S-adenosylmethionine:tRNA ribosyltransferase-isomerase [Solirubrobacteraceae bacterium]